jgi:dienelactone hydrolase
MRRLIYLIVLAATLPTAAAPKFWGALTPGTHPVGFRVMTGESIPGSAGWNPRPIEIAVWYPAIADAKHAPMTFGDYFALAADLKRRSERVAIAITGDRAGITAETEAEILASPMAALRDAEPQSRAFPVVMWSARYGTAAAQAVLSEFLASHGYVVAAARPKEAQEKLPFELKTAEEKLEELDAQSDDLRGALRAVRELAVADDFRTALVAWSYSGESAWRLAQADARIDLVIGLDTNVHANWVYHQRVDRVPLRFPFVSFDKNTPELKGLAHGNFNALEGMIPAVMGIDRVQKWSMSGPAAKSGYERLAVHVREALDRTFAQPRAAGFTTMELTAADGAKVTADLYRSASPRGCVALFHQSGSSRGEFRTIAPELVRLGYTALAVDVRWGNRDRWNDVVNETAARHGTPEIMRLGLREKAQQIRAGSMHDLDAAVDWLRENGCAKPVVWGSSIHANGVFELAARRPDVIGGVIDASPGEYNKEQPDRMKGIVARIATPSLVLWGRTERDLSKPIFDALPNGAKWSYESSGRHGDAIVFEDVAAWPAIERFLYSMDSTRLPKK